MRRSRGRPEAGSRERWLGLGASWLIGLAAPFAAPADELRAPVAIIAQVDGSFSFQAKFYKGPDADELASYGWFGEENVVGGSVADCFCTPVMCTMNDGDSLTIQVAGVLSDPELQGLVRMSVDLCVSPSHTTTTTIFPHWATGVDGQPSGPLRFWNAPNPVAPSTTFHWELQESGAVRLKIYDLAGRLVADLVDEIQPAGRHRASWNARVTKADGVYFARLSVGGRSLSRSLVVLGR